MSVFTLGVKHRVFSAGFTAETIWAADFDVEKRSLLLSWHFGKMSVDRKKRWHLKWSHLQNTLDYTIFNIEGWKQTQTHVYSTPQDRKSAKV